MWPHREHVGQRILAQRIERGAQAGLRAQFLQRLRRRDQLDAGHIGARRQSRGQLARTLLADLLLHIYRQADSCREIAGGGVQIAHQQLQTERQREREAHDDDREGGGDAVSREMTAGRHERMSVSSSPVRYA